MMEYEWELDDWSKDAKIRRKIVTENLSKDLRTEKNVNLVLPGFGGDIVKGRIRNDDDIKTFFDYVNSSLRGGSKEETRRLSTLHYGKFK